MKITPPPPPKKKELQKETVGGCWVGECGFKAKAIPEVSRVSV